MTTVKEKQLSEARKLRKEADSQHQVMLNRISFLRAEESKLDRDIENAKRRALELLSRKGEKAEKLHDDDIVATVKDILGTVAAPAEKTLRPVTGRSSIRDSTTSSLSSLAASHSGQCAKIQTASTSMPSSTVKASGPQRLRSASAQRQGRPPSGQALRPTLSSSSGSRKGSPAALLASSSQKTGVVTTMVSGLGRSPCPKASNGSGLVQLSAGSTSSDVSPPSLRNQQQSTSSSAGANRMDMLSGGREEIDMELIEELIAGTCHGNSSQETQLHGLQQFSTQATSRVVQVRAARRQDEVGSYGTSVAVLASGAGWGLPPPASGSGTQILVSSPTIGKDELNKKRQLRGVRKVFGLQPTPLRDNSAQVLECGAGSWQ